MVKKLHTTAKIDYSRCIVEDRLLQIRDQNASSELVLTTAWAITIEPKTSPKVLGLIRELSATDPIPLQHVKRLQKSGKGDLTVILCSVKLMNEEELIDKLNGGGIAYSTMSTLDVPAHCPPTKAMALEWGRVHWPLVWKGNTNDQILAEMTFDMAQIELHLSMISKTSTTTTTGLPIVTAIVDPELKEVIAVSSDSRHEHPLDHSIMKCINLVSSAEQKSRKDKDVADYHYLCSNYHVYTTHEPCTMCSMALIHSRISRLIYLKRSPLTGALNPKSGEGYIVHDHRLLNSKFEVFEWIGEDFRVPDIDPSTNA